MLLQLLNLRCWWKQGVGLVNHLSGVRTKSGKSDNQIKKSKDMYLAVLKITWGADFKFLEGVEGCLAWAFLGLSCIGLTHGRHWSNNNLNITADSILYLGMKTSLSSDSQFATAHFFPPADSTLVGVGGGVIMLWRRHIKESTKENKVEATYISSSSDFFILINMLKIKVVFKAIEERLVGYNKPKTWSHILVIWSNTHEFIVIWFDINRFRTDVFFAWTASSHWKVRGENVVCWKLGEDRIKMYLW